MVVVGKDVPDVIIQLSNGTIRYIILRIRDENIYVSDTGARNSSHEEFLKALKHDGCSYGIINPEDSTAPSPDSTVNLVLISWAPDSATLQNKIFYSSAYFILQNTTNIERTIQASEDEEISADAIKNA